VSSGEQMTAGSATQRRTRETGRGQTGDGRSGAGRGRGPVGQARSFTDTRAFEWLARGGFVTRGVVYALIGFLALKLALDAGGKATSQRGAMVTIAHQPLGKVLLILTAVGLVGYAVWRLISAAVGSREKDGNGAGKRLAALCSGIAYLALCYTAITVLTGSSTSGGSSSPKHEAAGVLGWPGGTVIVAVVGLVLIGVGLFQAYRGLSRQFLDDADAARMSGPAKHGYTALGVFGYLARMVVFVLIGYGLIKAAVDYSPHSAIGLDGALQNLSRSAFGPVVLGIVAAGLLGFGLFSIADARYHKI
jgi:hypothetical protein